MRLSLKALEGYLPAWNDQFQGGSDDLQAWIVLLLDPAAAPFPPRPFFMTTSVESIDLSNEEPVFPEAENGLKRSLDYLGYAPCPIRADIRRRLHRRFEAERLRTGLEPKWFMPTGCADPDPYEEIWGSDDEAGMPALISEGGIADILRPAFVRRWVDTGVYGPLPSTPKLRAEFEEAGMRDPAGVYHIYGVFSQVILVDLKRLGDRPLPSTWADLLDPVYRKDVIIGGEEGDISDVVLFNFHKEFGEPGLEALGRNVRDFWNSAQMARTAGTENPKGAALYVVPWFFASGNPHKERTRIVWPADGVLSMPLFLIGKPQSTPAARLAFDFFTGPECAAFMAQVHFPPSLDFGASTPALPGKLKWLGWDYLRGHGDLNDLRAPLNAAFLKGFRA